MKISIITICYNDVNGLRRTAKSVLSQQSNNYEWIVIDGGSNDGSKDVILEHQNEIDYWVSEKDSGIYNAMNKGVQAAKGDYCLFINSGDELFCSSSIDDIIKEGLSASIVACDIVQNNCIHGYKTSPSRIYANKLIIGSLPHQSTLIKRELLLKNPYREDLRIVSDWAFFFEALIIFGESYQYIHKPLGVFYLDGVSNTNSKGVCKERVEVLSKHLLPFQLNEISNVDGIMSLFLLSDTSKNIISTIVRFLAFCDRFVFYPFMGLIAFLRNGKKIRL